jgi:hypothetical protein
MQTNTQLAKTREPLLFHGADNAKYNFKIRVDPLIFSGYGCKILFYNKNDIDRVPINLKEFHEMEIQLNGWSILGFIYESDERFEILDEIQDENNEYTIDLKFKLDDRYVDQSCDQSLYQSFKEYFKLNCNGFITTTVDHAELWLNFNGMPELGNNIVCEISGF